MKKINKYKIKKKLLYIPEMQNWAVCSFKRHVDFLKVVAANLPSAAARNLPLRINIVPLLFIV